MAVFPFATAYLNKVTTNIYFIHPANACIIITFVQQAQTIAASKRGIQRWHQDVIDHHIKENEDPRHLQFFAAG